jgi:hypothetical protein
MLVSHEKEWTTAGLHINFNKHHAKWKQWDIKDSLFYNSILMKFPQSR